VKKVTVKKINSRIGEITLYKGKKERGKKPTPLFFGKS
jgi:hypothetical protein